MKGYILFVFIFLFSLILISGCSSTSLENKRLNEDNQMVFKTVGHDAGKMEVDRIVNETSYLGKDPKRLALIADLITSNFTNPNWQYQQKEEYFCYYPSLKKYTYCCSIAVISIDECDYIYDKFGRIRQNRANESNGIVLNRDPYWIAFQKTGQCQELSVFFNKTANDSSFVTRIVRSDGIGHMWNEVNIDGEWHFFDVQRYGMKDTDNSSKWFGNTSDYVEAYSWTSLCDLINKGKKPGIFVFNINTGGYGENRNQAYDPSRKCINQSATP
jgi:hypothetical protein